MNKRWLIARHEYLRHISRKGFLFAILSLPLLIVVIIGIVFIVTLFENDEIRPIAYVDLSGLLACPASTDDGVVQPPFPIVLNTEDEAREALTAGRIEAYYLISADYFRTSKVTLFHEGDVSDSATRRFSTYLQTCLLDDKPPAIARRAIAGQTLTIRSSDGTREFGNDPTFGQIMPLFSGFALMLLLFISAGYLTEAVVEEKENRTMEILVTTVSPYQLIVGKVMGIVASTFTQIIAWFVMLAAFVFSAGLYGLLWFQQISVNLGLMVLIMVLIVFAYLIFAALMVAVGSTVTDGQGSQQVAALLISALIFLLSSFPVILENPNGALALGLSIFPLSSPLVIPMRSIVMEIPVWQWLASIAFAVLCTFGAFWLAGRAFETGMLRYGRRLRWSELFHGNKQKNDDEASR